MSVNVYIEGYAPPDDDWRKHKAVWDACEAAGVDVPEETEKFFDYGEPSDDGVKVDINAAIDGEPEYGEGALIDLSKLPKSVKFIRVEMR